MIKALKVFEINPNLNYVKKESKVIRAFDPTVDNFFKEHIVKSIKNKHSKPCRFRKNDSDIVRYSKACFDYSTFDEASKEIAENLSRNIHYSVKNNFIFIVIWYFFEGENDFFSDEENILAILKMETNDGIQMIEDDFDVHPDMLPDLGNQLQKCSFVYKSTLEDFDRFNIDDKFHLKILDKQDSTISTYFINLMNSVVVADDSVMSQLANKVIKDRVKEYTTEENKKEVDKQMRIIMSSRKQTSIRDIVGQLEHLMEPSLLKSSNFFTIDAFSDDVFEIILKKNPSAMANFKTEPNNNDKYILRNDDRSVMISIEQGLLDNYTVKISETKNKYTLVVPKNLVEKNR